MMRHWGWRGIAGVGLAALLLAACEEDIDESAFRSVTIADEDEEMVPPNRCAVRGNATNAGNSRAHVRITYEAKDSQGSVIASSTAEFDVPPFSNFQFSNSNRNSQGQPSSGAFSNNVSCVAIDEIARTDLDVEAMPGGFASRTVGAGPAAGGSLAP